MCHSFVCVNPAVWSVHNNFSLLDRIHSSFYGRPSTYRIWIFGGGAYTVATIKFVFGECSSSTPIILTNPTVLTAMYILDTPSALLISGIRTIRVAPQHISTTCWTRLPRWLFDSTNLNLCNFEQSLSLRYPGIPATSNWFPKNKSDAQLCTMLTSDMIVYMHPSYSRFSVDSS